MATIREEIEKILLEEGFSEEDINLEDVDIKKVAGFVVSERFSDMPDMDRQNFLWKIFEGKLDTEDLLKIVAIITLSPDEVEAYTD
jgi:acid stress-induced BolA-like protein IbaG/YrbA